MYEIENLLAKQIAKLCQKTFISKSFDDYSFDKIIFDAICRKYLENILKKGYCSKIKCFFLFTKISSA